MKIQQIQAFVLAAELGSVSAAARQLGKRQPQLSQWIADLELDLGVELFVRSQNQIVLSPAGEQLLPRAILALGQCDQLQAEAMSLVQHGTGVITLGVENYIPMDRLSPVIDSYLRQFPQLDLVIRSGSQEALTTAFSDGDCNLILLHESLALHQPQWGYCRLGEYQELMLVNASHPLLGEPVQDPSRLAAYRELVWARGMPQGDELEVGYSGRYCLIPDLHTLLSVLKSSDGFALLPEDLVRGELDAGELRELRLSTELSPRARRLELRWHHGFDTSALGAPLLALLRQHLGQP
ncbi:LysR family transcriptional regulator [Shewanella cyperi]|uniref:LysR family transcriptional regulator n=1 Tax=Shewanella cyperi TaxID=2814292 RepID=A0A974XLG5_9GAMM|nr:LysR family transcriptional regulator [Shewanella cyperi]QSX30580.1 LysR family transcriptional regulator [Shewanella cyperi]